MTGAPDAEQIIEPISNIECEPAMRGRQGAMNLTLIAPQRRTLPVSSDAPAEHGCWSDQNVLSVCTPLNTAQQQLARPRADFRRALVDA